MVGHYKIKKAAKLFRQLDVRFATQPEHKYTYPLYEFDDQNANPLELAYALTVHKTQGSEFGTAFVVIPNPCWLLSRELIYTALTRQQDRVVVLHQGDAREFRRYSADIYSELASRMTNLFSAPSPTEVPTEHGPKFLEDGLIHKTKRGDLVRSKSEVIIANELFSQGIDRYQYEAALALPSGEVRYPDFTIVDDDTGQTFFWEHLGLLHNPEYKAKWECKLELYRRSKILPLEDGGGEAGTLIVTRDTPEGGIDSANISAIVSGLTMG